MKELQTDLDTKYYKPNYLNVYNRQMSEIENFSTFSLVSLYQKKDVIDRMFQKTLQAIDQQNTDITTDKQILIIKSYRKSIQLNKLGWRALVKKYKKLHQSQQSIKFILKEQIIKLTEQIKKIVKQFITCIDRYLQKKVASNQTQVLFWKIRGDLYRCLWEILYSYEVQKQKSKEISVKSKRNSIRRQELPKNQKLNSITAQIQYSYKEAFKVAEIHLPKDHIFVLGVYLNYSAFYYDIMNDVSKAFDMTKKALENLESCDEENNESTQNAQFFKEEKNKIRQYLNANITIWTDDFS